MTYLHRYDHTHGMNSEASLFLMTEKSATVLNGVTPNVIIGGLVKDVGYAQIGDAPVTKSILGMYHFIQNPSTNKLLVTHDDATGSDTELRYLNGANFTEITAAQTAWAGHTNANVEMETFIGYCFIVGHSDAGYLPVGSLTGTTFSTSTNVTNMPQGKFPLVFQDRVWVLNTRSSGTDYPGRGYKSSIPAAGAITWTPAADFLDFDQQYALTGGHVIWGKLLAFTQRRTYYYDGNRKDFMFSSRGCSAHRTIQSIDDMLIWGARDGLYISVGGSRPQKISGSINRFYMGGNPDTYFGTIVDNQYYLHLGTVTVGDATYTNTQAVYNFDTQLWYVRELGRHTTAANNHNMTIYALFDDLTNGQDRLYMGTDKGKVQNKGKHTDSTIIKDDDGLPIYSEAELAPFLMSPESKKKLHNIVSYARKAGGLKMYYRVVDNRLKILTEYEHLADLEQFENFISTFKTPGTMIQLKLSEMGSNEPWEYYGSSFDLELDGKPEKDA